MNFRKLYDYENESVSISKKIKGEDWDYWLAIQTIVMREAMHETTREGAPKYVVQILVISPEAVKEENEEDLDRALEYAADSLYVDAPDMSETDKVQALIQYGICATLAQFEGENKRKLEQEARKEVDKIIPLFGFYMDKPQNKVGNDGWDFISGNIGF